MSEDELERLRAALAHAHDRRSSPLRRFMRKLTEPLRGRIQKKAVSELVKKPGKKDAA